MCEKWMLRTIPVMTASTVRALAVLQAAQQVAQVETVNTKSCT